MKSGKCPKCGSENIYQSKRPKDRGVLTYVGHWIHIEVGFWKSKGVALVTFVCDDCQYTESYVEDDESMKNIREAWTPMKQRKSKRKNDEA